MLRPRKVSSQLVIATGKTVPFLAWWRHFSPVLGPCGRGSSVCRSSSGVRVRTDVENRHGQELLPGIAILLHCDIIDVKEDAGFPVDNPNGMRTGSEWQPEHFALWFQFGVMSHSLNSSSLLTNTTTN